MSVDSVAQEFVRAVRADDRANIASMLHYPFGAHIEGEGLRIIRTKEQLLSSFELALPSVMRDRVVTCRLSSDH